MNTEPKPTDAEIAAAQECQNWNMTGPHCAYVGPFALIIHKHNAPLHAKLKTQKVALELAQKAIEEYPEWDSSSIEPEDNRDANLECYLCGGFQGKGHGSDCLRVLALAAIKEALQ